jgi:RimJ/RimL family protein N-acetyltransferase
MALARPVGLRPVRDEDIEIFFGHQAEPEGAAMAGFPSRDRDTFFRHWERTLARSDARTMAITYGDVVAGNIGSWEQDDQVFLGYWIGSAFWGKGIATAALQAYLAEHEPRRPIHAHVVVSNAASIRVLEKCGFELVEGDEVELLLVRRAP